MAPVTIVTGGGRGIGAATVRRLAAAGHDVVIGYRTDTASAEAVRDEVLDKGRRAVAVAADTTVDDEVTRLFDAAATLGPLTGLVNNAATVSRIGPFLELSTEDMRRVVDVNVVGYLVCAREAARRMARSRGGEGGCIVNVSSLAAVLGSPGEYVHYAASKAAVETMTVGLAKELAPEGIRVTAVRPGTIYTDFHAMAGDAARVDRIGATVPIGRSGRPDEIAAAIAWLMSPDASYASGAVLGLTGGR